MPLTSNMSVEMRRAQRREEKRRLLATRTPQEAARDRALHAKKTRERRAKMPADIKVEVARRAAYLARCRRARLTGEEREKWLQRQAEYQRKRRARLSQEELNRIKFLNAERARIRRAAQGQPVHYINNGRERKIKPWHDKRSYEVNTAEWSLIPYDIILRTNNENVKSDYLASPNTSFCVQSRSCVDFFSCIGLQKQNSDFENRFFLNIIKEDPKVEVFDDDDDSFVALNNVEVQLVEDNVTITVGENAFSHNKHDCCPANDSCKAEKLKCSYLSQNHIFSNLNC